MKPRCLHCNREIHQMISTRAIELATPDVWVPQSLAGAIIGVIPRLLVGFVVCLLFSPILLVFFCLNYTINAVEAIVDNRTKKLEAELAATREKIDKLTNMLQAFIDKQP